MVELFTRPRFAGTARSGSPVPPVARLEAPHASQVKRTMEVRIPWTGFVTCFEHDGPGFDYSQGVSASPPLEMYRIECRDYSERIMRSGLLRQASVELGEHLSMRPSSTERSHGGWLVRPLSRVGSSVYRVRSPIDLRLAVTVPPRRFGAERRDDAVDEINSSRASDAQQRAGQ